MRLAPTSAGMQLLPSSKQHAATCPRTPPAVHAAARRLRRCQKQRSALQATEQPTGVVRRLHARLHVRPRVRSATCPPGQQLRGTVALHWRK